MLVGWNNYWSHTLINKSFKLLAPCRRKTRHLEKLKQDCIRQAKYCVTYAAGRRFVFSCLCGICLIAYAIVIVLAYFVSCSVGNKGKILWMANKRKNKCKQDCCIYRCSEVWNKWDVYCKGMIKLIKCNNVSRRS